MPLWRLKRNLKIRAKDGTDVWINKSTWYDHILVNHQEMKDTLRDVIATLKDPDAIYLGDSETRFAFKYSEKRGKFIMVLYHRSSKQGRVKTAYAVSDPDSVVLGKMKVYPR